jgi:hypothetical protein
MPTPFSDQDFKWFMRALHPDSRTEASIDAAFARLVEKRDALFAPPQPVLRSSLTGKPRNLSKVELQEQAQRRAQRLRRSAAAKAAWVKRHPPA